MYGYYYILTIQVYIIKLTYRAYTMQLEENSNLDKLSLWIYFGEEYHYSFRLMIAEGFNIYKRSKQKIYEDNRLVYKLSIFIKYLRIGKIKPIIKLGWVNLQEYPFPGFLIFLILYCFDRLNFRPRIYIYIVFFSSIYIDFTPYFLFFNFKKGVWSHLMRRKI